MTTMMHMTTMTTTMNMTTMMHMTNMMTTMGRQGMMSTIMARMIHTHGYHQKTQ
jgi:hypothetical protein